MPEQIQFDSPWSVAVMDALFDDVASAKGTSESLTAKIGTLANADLSNVSLTTYTTPDLHSNARDKVTIQSGGYIMLGNICILNCRIQTTAQLSGSGLLANLPAPVCASGLDSGSSVVAVTNQKGLSLTITNQNNLIIASTSLPIAADTVICMSAVYPCVLPS